MATAIFMDGFIVASSIAISDLVRREVDPSGTDTGTAFAAHIFVAFAIMVGLRVFLYSVFWYGRGSLADRSSIKPPGFHDFFNCPDGATINDCYAGWWDTLTPTTYETQPTRDNLLQGSEF
jgi:hypothetical protein